MCGFDTKWMKTRNGGPFHMHAYEMENDPKNCSCQRIFRVLVEKLKIGDAKMLFFRSTDYFYFKNRTATTTGVHSKTRKTRKGKNRERP